MTSVLWMNVVQRGDRGGDETGKGRKNDGCIVCLSVCRLVELLTSFRSSGESGVGVCGRFCPVFDPRRPNLCQVLGI